MVRDFMFREGLVRIDGNRYHLGSVFHSLFLGPFRGSEADEKTKHQG